MMGEYYKRFADAIDVPVEEVEKFFENKKDAEPSKVKNRCNSLLTDDSDGRKEHESKLDCTDFINWLRDEVLNEEMWELNAIGYGEIIARKLTKLGAMECEDGYYYSVDRPKGKWIDMNTKENHYIPRYKCSVCGNWANHSNFCPNCGADMRGEDDD